MPNVKPAGQFDPAQPAQFLDPVLLQPAVAADRELAGHLAGDREFERGDEIVDVAELPAGRATLHREQPRRLEMPGDQRVHVLADERRRPHHGDLHAGIGARRPPRQVLDLDQVTGDAGVLIGLQRRILGERNRVVGAGAVHHRAGHKHHPADALRRRGGEHGLRTAYVERPAFPVITVGRQIQVGMHHHVHPGETAGQHRVTHIHHPPDDPGDLAAVVVYRHHLLDPA